jgi:hypothetical protein
MLASFLSIRQKEKGNGVQLILTNQINTTKVIKYLSILLIIRLTFNHFVGKVSVNNDRGDDFASIRLSNRRLTNLPCDVTFVFPLLFLFLSLPFALLQYHLCLFRHVNLSTQMKLPSRYPDTLGEEKDEVGGGGGRER